MKNVKQIAFGLIIGLMAIGFSAFTNAKPNKSKFTTFYYGLNHAGDTYIRSTTNPASGCHTASLPDCVISYPADKGATLDPNSLPTGSTVVSGPGWVNP
ncbi:MAG: hypothetical protein JWR09_737 [Mucilaginibacter sp.]|nr:hypothetical protein [Mucilaginibacter sp.]